MDKVPTKIDDELDQSEERSLTSTGKAKNAVLLSFNVFFSIGANQLTEADKWWAANGGDPPQSGNDPLKPQSAGNVRPLSKGLGFELSQSTSALPTAIPPGTPKTLSKPQSQPILASLGSKQTTKVHLPRASSRAGLSSLLLPALPSEDLESMSDGNAQPGKIQLKQPGSLKPKLVPKQALSSNKNIANHHIELKFKRATDEIDHLAKRLDESEKEKLNQQSEISRLRNQMNKILTTVQVMPNSTSPRSKHQQKDINHASMQPSINSSIFMGSNRDDGLYPVDLLTNADKTGTPSVEDLDTMRISSAKGSTKTIAKPTATAVKIQPSSGEGPRAARVIESKPADLKQVMEDEDNSIASSLSSNA